MTKAIHFFIITIIVWFSFTCTAYAWPIYYKPEYCGRIIDAETKAPIEGAVVVVLYIKERIIGNVGGSVIHILDAKEILTDSKGEFYFPSYTAFTPFWSEHFTGFLIYKPGWQGFAPSGLDGPMTEKFFSINVIGEEDEIRSGQDHWKGPLGVMELKKGDKIPSAPTGYRSDKLPLFFKAINEERKRLRLEGEEK